MYLNLADGGIQDDASISRQHHHVQWTTRRLVLLIFGYVMRLTRALARAQLHVWWPNPLFNRFTKLPVGSLINDYKIVSNRRNEIGVYSEQTHLILLISILSTWFLLDEP